MSLYEPFPRYLLEKFQLTATVVFVALFSLVFMLLSIPFSHNIWFSLSWTESFAFTVVFFLISTAVVSLSKKLMYESRDKVVITYLQYILWCFAEVVIISLLYTFFTMKGVKMGYLEIAEDITPEKTFLSAMAYVFVSLFAPYVIAGEYFTINEKDNTIRLLNMGNVVSDTEEPAFNEKKITLFDSNGVMKLSISLQNLYYMESDDNYIKVWYTTSGGEMKMYMLRCRLKTVEDGFRDSDLVRCHRKYIVNMNKVKAMSRESGGFILDLGLEETIPVSKTYEESVLERYNDR